MLAATNINGKTKLPHVLLYEVLETRFEVLHPLPSEQMLEVGMIGWILDVR